MQSYTYNDYSINLENHKTFIKIKIINNIVDYFFEKNITLNDISLGSLDKYYSLIQNCLSNKPGFTIEFNEYSSKIDMIVNYETEFLDIHETVSLDKYSNNDIETMQNQIIKLNKEIIELRNIIDTQKPPSKKIQIGYIQKITGENLIDDIHLFNPHMNRGSRTSNIPNITNIEQDIIEFDEFIESIEYEFPEEI